MQTYRGINYKIENNLVYFQNPQGVTRRLDADGKMASYGRGSMVRTLPSNLKATPMEFVKVVIDALYDRMSTYKAQEERLFWASKSTKNLKNMCK